MTFLAPAAGLLAAAAALPILLALYLLRLRRRAVRVSSTILWEQSIVDLEANVPLRWLRASWLLVLQLAAILLAIIAIARPAITGAFGSAQRTILLIDHSASMNATDGAAPDAPRPGTRLDQAKARALESIEAALRSAPASNGARPELMVIGYAAEPRALTGFTPRQRELREAVESLEPSDQPDDLAHALEIVRAMQPSGGTEDQPTPRTSILIFTDHPLGSIPGLPPGATVQTVLVGPAARAAESVARPDNLGITTLAAVRDSTRPALVRVFCRIVNAGNKPVEATVVCRVNDEPVGSMNLSFPATHWNGPETPAPASTPAIFEFERASGGLLTVAIARPDVLPGDNLAAIVLRPATRPRVLVVGPGADDSDPFRGSRGEHGVDRFLLGVLNEVDLALLRVIDLKAYDTAAPHDAGRPDPWDEFDLIVFDRVEPHALPPQPTLSFGAGLPSIGIEVHPSPPDDPAAEPTRFALWSRAHAVFRYAAPDTVLVAPPMLVTVPEANPSPPAHPSGHTVTELVQGAHGPLVLAIDDERAPGMGVRRLVVAFDLLRSNWGTEVSFPVFIASAIDHLSGRGDAAAGIAYTTTEDVSVTPRPGVPTLTISGPRSFTRAVERPPLVDSAAASISIGVLDRTGLYTVAGAIDADALIAVNTLNEPESLLGGSMMSSPAIPPSHASGTAGETPEGHREVWHWFVAAAGVLSCIEWIVYALRSRV